MCGHGIESFKYVKLVTLIIDANISIISGNKTLKKLFLIKTFAKPKFKE